MRARGKEKWKKKASGGEETLSETSTMASEAGATAGGGCRWEGMVVAVACASRGRQGDQSKGWEKLSISGCLSLFDRKCQADTEI